MSQFPADPHFNSVVLFLPFEGTNGDTTFVDSSINNYPMSSSGANLGTTQVKFSTQTTSAEITGALGNSITTTASPLNETMSWTIETWIYPMNPGYGGASRTSPFHPIAYQYNGGGSSDQGIWIAESGFLTFYRGPGHTDATAQYNWSRGFPGSPQAPIPFDDWTHVAVCYDNGSPRVMTAFINGNQCNELPAVIDGGWFDSSNPFRIGDAYHPSYPQWRSTANAYYSDYRISSFVRYTGDFRPPRGPHPTRGIATDNPITPGDPYFDNVVVLLPFEGNDGDTTTTDIKGNTITINGSGQIDTSQSVFETSSYLCDGAITFSTQPLIDYGLTSSNWTVEFWYRPDGTASVNDRLFQTRDGDFVTGIYIAHEQTDASQLSFGLDTNGSSPWDYLSSGIDITNNVWQHIALVRNGSDVTFYLDGVSQISTTYTGKLYMPSSDTCCIGAQTVGTTRANGGWIDNFRITARAKYTGDFRPPRGPHPTRIRGSESDIVSKGLQLLLDAGNETSYPGTGTTWYDISGNSNDYTLSGPTHVAGNSGYFITEDGDNISRTSDSLLAPGAGDFTVSAWILKTELVENAYLWDFGTNGMVVSAGTSINGVWRYYTVSTGISSDLYTANSAPTADVWHNITVVRESGTTTFYLNNVAETSDSDAQSITSNPYIARYGGNTTSNHIGRYAAFMVYHRALTAEERTQNHNVFLSRYS